MKQNKILLMYCWLVITLLKLNYAGGSKTLQEEISFRMERNNSITNQIFSRKRRYLMFPSGSSFQVAVGSYFVFGHTAALAWELPNMPFTPKMEEEPAETTTTVMPDIEINELDHGTHETISNDLSLWNPTYENLNRKYDSANFNFNRRPVDSYSNPFSTYIRESGYSTVKRPSYVAANDNNSLRNMGNTIPQKHVKGNLQNINFPGYSSKGSHMMMDIHPKYYDIYRRTRRDLYKKIERFLPSINMEGKACILKAICEIRQSSQEKEAFMKEVFKAIFRAKPGEKQADEDEYDAAANSEHNCTEMYSTCQGSIRNIQLINRK